MCKNDIYESVSLLTLLELECHHMNINWFLTILTLFSSNLIIPCLTLTFDTNSRNVIIGNDDMIMNER
jgi:hypothetical protein